MTCDHDPRFGDIFGLPPGTNACLACHAEWQAQEIERLQAENDDQRQRLVDLHLEAGRLRQGIKTCRDEKDEAIRILEGPHSSRTLQAAARAAAAEAGRLRAALDAAERENATLRERLRSVQEIRAWLRCGASGNLCGTDTYMAGRPCLCAFCNLWQKLHEADHA